MNKFGKIYDFKTTINDMCSYFDYVNESNELDHSDYPTLYCIGTIKVCGTQMAVVESNHQRHYQSKNKIITTNDDNYDCAKFCEEHKYNFDSIFNKIYKNYGYDEDLTYCVFIEYFGKDISGHNTAISNLDRKAMIFDVRIFDNQKKLLYSELDNIISCNYDCGPILSKLYGHDIFNTYMFKTYELLLDLQHPEETAEKINIILQSIENECPVGKFFNTIGICEGIVWSTRLYDKLFTFKTKTRTYLEGDNSRKNKKPKEKLIIHYEPEVIEKVETFVNESITFDRIEQAKNHINKSEFNDIRDLGKVIKFMINDILEEERLTITHNNFSKDLVCKCIAEQVKKLFNIQN